MLHNKKERYGVFYLAVIITFLVIIPYALAYPGKICGSASPCTCGTNCSSGTGGNELFGNSQEYCEANPIECFNTDDDCKDGSIVSLNYVKDITITSHNDTVFREGDLLEIDATLYSSSANSEGVFFVHANGSGTEGVNWSTIYSTTFGVASSDYHIYYNYTIPRRVGTQSIRVVDIYLQTTNITCGRSADAIYPPYSDTDDMIFTVLAQPAPSINFSGPTPSNQSSQTTVTIVLNVTHTDNHPDTLILNWNGTNESYSYSTGHTAITKTNLGQGNYTFYFWANNTFGYYNQTETRAVNINTPIDISISSPSHNSYAIQSLIDLNVTVSSNKIDRNISNVKYQLNQDSNVTITSKLNISNDLTDTDGRQNISTIGKSNISQSFVPNVLMEARNISLKLHRTGNPNASLQIRADNSGSPSSTVLLNLSIDNSSVSTSDYSWIIFYLNTTLTFDNKTKYWITLESYGDGSNEDHYAWEANDENITASGESNQNTSKDMLFRIIDLNRYRTKITVSEGTNNVTIYGTNTAGVTISSSKISFTLDNTPPFYSGVNESSDPVEIGEDITIKVNASDVSASISKVIIEINKTNHTMSEIAANQYSITINTETLGPNNFTFYINDTLGNLNKSGNYSFAVVDTAAPVFGIINYNPSSSDDLDPLVLVNITLNITDFALVDKAILQYKNSSLNWTNVTMDNSTTLFFSNFTPATPGNWSFRIWVNDTSNNYNYSDNLTLNISYDYSWTRTPASFSPLSGIGNTVVTVGNFTINNTGDYLLSFDYTASRAFFTFNKTTSFTIEPKGYEIIEVNATAPLEEAEYPTTITIDAENASAEPDTSEISATLVSIATGAYLIVTIEEYNSTVSPGDFFSIVAKITNVGNETANSVVSNWTMPSDWITIPRDLNRTLGNLGVNKFEYHNLSVFIPTDEASGTYSITNYAESTNGANNSDIETVTVVSTGDTIVTVQDSSGGGGGGGGSSGGGGAVVYNKPEYDLKVDAPENLELLIETTETFNVNATNNVPDTVIKNLDLTLSGFLLSKIKIDSPKVELLEYGDNVEFSISIDIPKYYKFQNKTLTLEFSGIGRDATDHETNTRSEENFSKEVGINLIILEVTEEIAQKYLSESQLSIKSLKEEGYNTAILESLLSITEEAFNNKDFKLAVENSKKISDYAETARSLRTDIESLQTEIENLEESGLDVEEASKLLDIAIEHFNEGDFVKAKEMFEKALLSRDISMRVEQTKFWNVFTDYIISNLYFIIIVIVIGLLSGMIIKKEFTIKGISEKMRSLDHEEDNLLDLMKKTQAYYFKDKMMSERLYKKTMSQYTSGMTAIQNKKANLQSRKITLLERRNDKDALTKEKLLVNNLIKDLQTKYYIKEIITKETYDKTIETYKNRIAEIDKILGLVEEGKDEKTEDYKPSSEIIKKEKTKEKKHEIVKEEEKQKAQGKEEHKAEEVKKEESHKQIKDKEELEAHKKNIEKEAEEREEKKTGTRIIQHVTYDPKDKLDELRISYEKLKKKSVNKKMIRKMVDLIDHEITMLPDYWKEDEHLRDVLHHFSRLKFKYGSVLKKRHPFNNFKFN